MLKLFSFDRLLEQATRRFQSLPESIQRELKESLENGKGILRQRDQMDAYLHFYGEIHRQKLLRAFKHLPESLHNRNISVIDWGCGQGLASMIFSDYMEKEQLSLNTITDLSLIDPSKICLNRAIGFLEWIVPKTWISTIVAQEQAIHPEDLCIQEDYVIHLLSNVVDMPEFSGDGILRVLNANKKSYHVIVMVSPFYPEEGRGKRMDIFAERLKGFKQVYSFQKHREDWKEDYSCQIRIYDNANY